MTEVMVKLGEAEVPVYPQRHAYLTNKLGKWFSAFAEGATKEGTETIAFFGDQAYDVLCVLIPAYGKRVSRHEFAGYGSAEAMEAGDYREEDDKSPSVPELVDAFETAKEVNRFDVFGAIFKIVDPQMLRSLVNQQVAERILKSSQSSLPQNGESDQTSSGTTPPTSTENAD